MNHIQHNFIKDTYNTTLKRKIIQTTDEKERKKVLFKIAKLLVKVIFW